MGRQAVCPFLYGIERWEEGAYVRLESPLEAIQAARDPAAREGEFRLLCLARESEGMIPGARRMT